MRLQIILTVSFVNFGLKHVESYPRMDDKAVINEVDNTGQIQKNFLNLINSVAKNNDKGNIEQLYSEALKEKASKGQQVYNVMKDQLQSAKIENSHKKTNFLKKNDMHENTLLFKRAWYRSTPAPGTPGCPVEWGAKVPVGRHSIDVDECIVWYCNANFILEDFECKIIRNYPNQYRKFYQECLETGCT